ncbi:MAG TPA: alanine--tRNA ligase, partial [Bacteroidota bacterium]|nr:alanine--tRNA ligase [Bacteroidota bacterium]
FFEMLGNWSFGDYYKKEAIGWAWELLTKTWGLDPSRLYATIFESDDEAGEIWRAQKGMAAARIRRFGRKDNFWEMGETGPCGPCSEIHIDLTADGNGGPLVNAGDPRVMEIWNLVFIQYNRDENGTLHPLPLKHVDTGMGFERIAAVLQHKRSNYDTDVFMPIIDGIALMTGIGYTGSLSAPADVAMRVIADHIRMLTFSIADGGIPSNEGRGYVIRRILRRASRFGRNLGLRDPFLHRIVAHVCGVLGRHYPEIVGRRAACEKIIRAEEESFNQTLDRGLEIFETVAAGLPPGAVFPAADSFRLYDTFGFPFDLTRLLALERGLAADEAGFAALMDRQRAQSRSGRTADTGAGAVSVLHDSQSARKLEIAGAGMKSVFTGYTCMSDPSEVVGADRNAIVLTATPFYAESGGQIGDTGVIIAGEMTYHVVDTQKSGDVIIHLLERAPRIGPGERVVASVDEKRRTDIARNHTATHLVHEALRVVLGNQLHQQGSLVAPDRLRFDFNHNEKISPDRIRAIEEMVNEKISLDIAVNALNDPADWLTIEEAKRQYPNLKMFFGEKYGDRVRIVEIDPRFSVELCGGTHVPTTSELGCFKIVSESGISSGIRRVEAVTGEGFRAYIESLVAESGELDARLGELYDEYDRLSRVLGIGAPGRVRSGFGRPRTGNLSLPAAASLEKSNCDRVLAIGELTRDTQSLRKDLAKKRVGEASSALDGFLAGRRRVADVDVVSGIVSASDMEELKELGDRLREKIGSGVGVLGAVIGGKAAVVCIVTEDLVKGKKLSAGKIVAAIAKLVDGGGGGRPLMATAGGKDAAGLGSALEKTDGIVAGIIGV